MLYMGTGQMMVSAIDIDEVRQEASNISLSDKLNELVVSPADLTSGKAVWVGENEIRYDGRLYDVAGRSVSADKTILKVKWDGKEESLISELGEHIENMLDNLPVHNKSTKHVIKSFGKDYFSYSYTFVSMIHSDYRASIAMSNSPMHTSASIEIHSPPPQA